MVGLEMIEKFSTLLPFQVRLSVVLPLLSHLFEGNTHHLVSVRTKLKCRALDVVLNLFPEFHSANTD